MTQVWVIDGTCRTRFLPHYNELFGHFLAPCPGTYIAARVPEWRKSEPLRCRMPQADLSDRYYASIPADDPRFTELREVLASVKQQGRHSPASRMLGEWALLGFLLTTGRIAIAGAVDIPSHSGESPDTAEWLASKHQIEASIGQIGGFEE